MKDIEISNIYEKEFLNNIPCKSCIAIAMLFSPKEKLECKNSEINETWQNKF